MKKGIQSKRNVFGTLRQMLSFYDSYRYSLRMTKDHAIEKTLDTYEDFYEWLIGEIGKIPQDATKRIKEE